jgi:hypothetical protein
MSYPSAPPGTYQIDVIDQVGRAYRAVLDRVRLVVEMALLPYLIVLAATLVAVLMPGGVFGGILAALINAIAFLIFGSIFLVRWHRSVLLDETVGEGLIPEGWTEFIIATIKLGAIVVAGWVVLVLVGAMPPHMLTIPLVAIGGAVMSLMAMRVSLIFPAAAIGRPVALRTAWDWLQGNFWRLFACVLAAYFPFFVVTLILNAIGALFPSLLWIVFEALQLAISFVSVAVIAALLSHLYRDIGANNGTG